MNRREALQQAHSNLAARDRRRMIALVATGGLALALFVTLEITSSRSKPTPVQDVPAQGAALSLPVVAEALLTSVRDGDLAEQVLLEPEPTAHLALLARSLLPALLQRLGEPAFPFDAVQEQAASLRGKIYRMRGTLVQSESKLRSAGGKHEYWVVLRDETGHEALHVSVYPPEAEYAPGDWVLADGYFLKQHSTTLGGERRTLPLFFGRTLLASVPRAEAELRPDPLLLSRVVDPPHGVDMPPDLDATWHLSNVALSLSKDAAAADALFRDAPWLSVELLAQLNDTPEAFRGAPIRVGGAVFHGSRRAVEENPLRVEFLSEAWVRNSNIGEYPMLVRTPGRFDFEKVLGAWEFRCWFQQMWSYEDLEGHPRRVPIFVFADAKPIASQAPPFVGQLVWIVFGILIVLASGLFLLVRRDRNRAVAAERRLVERRKLRRGA